MHPISIPLEDFQLAGRFSRAEGPGVALILHPHPLYGGTMDNNVVLAARDAALACGMSALRFDFRGAGRSGGSHGGGAAEARDVLAAAAWLRQELGDQSLQLVGYSFGARVALGALKLGLAPASLALVAPPVDAVPFDDLVLPEAPSLVMAGSEDVYCRPDTLAAWLSSEANRGREPQVESLAGADHFLWGREGALRRVLGGFFRGCAGRGTD